MDWTRHKDVSVRLDHFDPKSLVPSLRRTSLDRVALDAPSIGLAFDGEDVWVTTSEALWKIDVEDPSACSIALVARGLGPLAFDGSNLWINSLLDNRVLVFDPQWNVIRFSPAVGNHPGDLVFDGSHVWVSNYYDGTLSKVDVQTLAVATVRVTGSPERLSFDGRSVWVLDSVTQTISKVHKSTNTVTTFGVPGIGPAIAFDGTHMWVPLSGGLVKLDINSNSQVGSVGLWGLHAAGMAFDGNLLWVTSGGARKIFAIDPAGLSVTRAVGTTGWAREIIFDGTDLWFADHLGNFIHRISAVPLGVETSPAWLGG